MSSNDSQSGERLVHIAGEHWVTYVRLVFIYVLMLFASAFFFYLAGLTVTHNAWLTEVLFIAALGLALLDHHWFFMALLSESETHLIVTTKRVIWIRQHLFFGDEMLEYSFEKMKTVESHRNGILQYLLQYGTLKFESGEDIPYVPHPNTVARIIEQAMGLK